MNRRLLPGKCLRDGRAHDDVSVSPVVRQTLLHWAFELGASDFTSGAKRVKTHGATYMPREQLVGVLSASASRKRKAEEVEASEEQVAKLTGEQNAEREMRAQRRRDGGDAPAAKRTRGASSGGAASSSSAAASSDSGQAPKKRKPAELSAYERARDDQRAENEGKLRELGLA